MEVIMGQAKGYKPGEKAPDSAQYQIIGPRGSKGAERTVVKDKILPPTPVKGSHYIIKDRTKHK